MTLAKPRWDVLAVVAVLSFGSCFLLGAILYVLVGLWLIPKWFVIVDMFSLWLDIRHSTLRRVSNTYLDCANTVFESPSTFRCRVLVFGTAKIRYRVPMPPVGV